MSVLTDRMALVTGASAGIGAATARALAGAGATVLLAARRGDRLAELAARIPRAVALPFDVRDHAAVSAALEGRELDIVVANAGMALGVEPLQSGDPEDWSVMIDTNIKGVLHVLRAALPAMIARGRGDVVILGSVAGRQVYAGGNVYNATKYAVRALYEALRLDVAGKGIRVSTIDPGLVETEFSMVRFRGDANRAAAAYKGMHPLCAEDVAEAILWVVSRPAHVNVGELVLWPTDQASTTVVRRDSPPPGAPSRPN